MASLKARPKIAYPQMTLPFYWQALPLIPKMENRAPADSLTTESSNAHHVLLTEHLRHGLFSHKYLICFALFESAPTRTRTEIRQC